MLPGSRWSRPGRCTAARPRRVRRRVARDCIVAVGDLQGRGGRAARSRTKRARAGGRLAGRVRRRRRAMDRAAGSGSRRGCGAVVRRLDRSPARGQAAGARPSPRNPRSEPGRRPEARWKPYAAGLSPGPCRSPPATMLWPTSAATPCGRVRGPAVSRSATTGCGQPSKRRCSLPRCRRRADRAGGTTGLGSAAECLSSEGSAARSGTRHNAWSLRFPPLGSSRSKAPGTTLTSSSRSAGARRSRAFLGPISR